MLKVTLHLKKRTFWYTAQKYRVHRGIYLHRPDKCLQVLGLWVCMYYMQIRPASLRNPVVKHANDKNETCTSTIPVLKDKMWKQIAKIITDVTWKNFGKQRVKDWFSPNARSRDKTHLISASLKHIHIVHTKLHRC